MDGKLNPTISQPVSIEEFAQIFLQSIDADICKPGAATCKYDSSLNRDTINYAFSLLEDFVKQAKTVSDSRLSKVLLEAEKVITEKEVLESLDEFKNQFDKWYDHDSPLGKLQTYFEVFGVRNSAQHTIRSLATAYMRFTNFMPEFTEEEAVRFLRTRNCNSSSRRTYSRMLRTFFKAQGIHRDKLPFEHNKIRVDEEDRPKRRTYTYDKVKDFITHIRRSGDCKAAFYGALITTYGFRPIELSQIRLKDIDTKNHIIKVQTAKHGRVRTHHIPEAIRPYLYGYDPKPIADMRKLWKSICSTIGFRPLKRYGWYGIRHALFTNLVNKSGIHAMVLDKWGGWQTGYVSGAGMVSIYHAPDSSDMNDIDREVLSKHPFLRFWNSQ